MTLFFAQHEESQDVDSNDDETEDSTAAAPSQPTRSQPSASSSSKNPASRGGGAGNRPKQMTMADLQRGDDDEGEGDGDDKNQDMFAGGEKSGLAVQNPGQDRPVDHFRNIMNQARQNRERPPGTGEDDDEEHPTRSNFFTGRAQTLGGDDAPSEVVEDPQADPYPTRQRQQSRVNRTLHLWADGISIDDGPLLRFDDPANQHIMAEINQGRAPKALLDVTPEQEVDLNLEPHRGENYVAPKKKYQPFGGQGQRLGSPTPALATSSSSSTAPPTTQQQPASATAAAAGTTEMTIDDSQPTLQLQIRLGDGTRLSSRFNTTHTVGDVYAFVDRASPTSQQRVYALMTTFPSKELKDKSQVLGEMSDFKRGGVVVQKWS